jgi:hypothetical protein
MEVERNGYRLLVGKPEGTNHLEDIDVDGSYAKQDGMTSTRFMWLGIGGSCRML